MIITVYIIIHVSLFMNYNEDIFYIGNIKN